MLARSNSELIGLIVLVECGFKKEELPLFINRVGVVNIGEVKVKLP